MSLLIRLGAPREHPLFYRDVALGLVFVSAVVVGLVLGTEAKMSAVFFLCVGVAAVTFTLATKRLMLIGGACAFSAIRFAIAFLVSPSAMVAVLSVSCALLALAAIALDPTEYDSPGG